MLAPRTEGNGARGSLKAYLAGTGATGALVIGALIAFLSAAAFVAFNGFSFPGSTANSSVALGTRHAQQIPGAARLAAAAVAAGPAAVAASPTPVVTPSSAGTRPSFGIGGINDTGGSDVTGDTTGTFIGGDTDGGPPPASTGPLTGTVQRVDDTTGGLGGPTLGQVTQPVTQRVDDTVTNTLNNVGGLLGQDNLGDRTGQTVDTLTRRLLGGGLLHPAP